MKKFSGFIFVVILSLVLTACSQGGVPSTGDQAVPTTAAAVATTVPQLQPAAATVVSQAQPTAADSTAPTAPATEAAIAAASPAPLTSKELNLYAWSEYIPQALLDGFQKEYGVTVHYDTYSSNEEMVAKLQAGASGYDVIIPSDYMVGILAKQNLIQPIDQSQIPNIKNIDPKFSNPQYDPGNKYTVPYQWGTVGMVVNTDKVTKKLTSWSDLWDPAFKSRVVLLDDEREDLGMVLLTLGYDKNSTDPKQLDEAKAKFKQLMPNIKLFDSDSPKTALLSGEVWLGQTWNGEAALAHQQNPKIDYLCPKEGCGIWFDNLAVPAGAPHPDAAMAFLNYVLRPDVSILITKEFPYSNPNKAALDLMQTQEPDLYKSYMAFSATNPSEADIKNAHPVLDVGDATTLWDKVWTEVKGQ